MRIIDDNEMVSIRRSASISYSHQPTRRGSDVAEIIRNDQPMSKFQHGFPYIQARISYLQARPCLQAYQPQEKNSRWRRSYNAPCAWCPAAKNGVQKGETFSHRERVYNGMDEMGRSYNTHHATAKAGETSSQGRFCHSDYGGFLMGGRHFNDQGEYLIAGETFSQRYFFSPRRISHGGDFLM